jgi:hypothetical protein
VIIVVEKTIKRRTKKPKFGNAAYDRSMFCSDKCHRKAEKNYREGIKWTSSRWVSEKVSKGYCPICDKRLRKG